MATQFITLLPPPGPKVLAYRPNFSSTDSIPPPFLDALNVRIPVFIHEQQCDINAEIDDDDARSWHWIVYASVNSPSVSTDTSTDTGDLACRESEGAKVPVGTIRLISPHAKSHPEAGKHYAGDDVGVLLPAGTPNRSTTYHDGREPYIILGRLAVLKEYRGLGLARLLVNTALEWAGKHAEEIRGLKRNQNPVERELELRREGGGDVGSHKGEEWRGLCLLHAQTAVEKFYKSLGFETDEGMGKWWEEEIEHVGMWKRIDIGERV